MLGRLCTADKTLRAGVEAHHRAEETQLGRKVALKVIAPELAGGTVTFEITNGDPIDHEFILGDEEIQKVHEEGTEKHHDSRPGEISVPANATVSTTYTFEEPGELIYGCHIFGHYDYGMRGAVEVR